MNNDKNNGLATETEVKPEKKQKTADEIIREKEREKMLKNKSAREAAEFKKRYFAYYDDIKISHREDW